MMRWLYGLSDKASVVVAIVFAVLVTAVITLAVAWPYHVYEVEPCHRAGGVLIRGTCVEKDAVIHP